MPTRGEGALDAVINRGTFSVEQRNEIRSALAPALRAASHGFAVALGALEGPDPEVAALFARDTLRSLHRDLARASSRLPLP